MIRFYRSLCKEEEGGVRCKQWKYVKTNNRLKRCQVVLSVDLKHEEE